jgi:hypothetical protein
VEVCRFRLLCRAVYSRLFSGDKQLLFALSKVRIFKKVTFISNIWPKWLDAGGSAEPVENHLLKKLADLRKNPKPFILFTLRYR